jgi:Histidine kinase-, DNA gyrase B-, and HSP90-like ATPase
MDSRCEADGWDGDETIRQASASCHSGRSHDRSGSAVVGLRHEGAWQRGSWRYAGRRARRDHGPDVPEAELAKFFQPFYRLGSVHARHTAGAGWGLAIAERAVRLHGGTIVAANTPGGGLLMTICIPVVPTNSSPREGGAAVAD